MDKKLEEAIKILETFKARQKTINYNKISLEDVEAIETVLNYIDNSISTEVIEEKKKKAKEEYQCILENIDRKISHMKDKHKIRGTYAEFGVKRGRLEILEELLEKK